MTSFQMLEPVARKLNLSCRNKFMCRLIIPVVANLKKAPRLKRTIKTSFPPPALPGITGTMALSDSRPNQFTVELLRIATPRPGRVSHVAQGTFLACCPHYPGGSVQVDRLQPCPASAFPEYGAGRHPRLSFRGLLRVHSRYGLSGCCSPIDLHLSPEL